MPDALGRYLRAALLLGTLLSGGVFVHHYFTEYVRPFAFAFENFGLRQAARKPCTPGPAAS